MTTSEKNDKQQPALLVETGLHADWAARPLVDDGFAIRAAPLERLAGELDSGAYHALLFGQWDLQRKTKQAETAIMTELAAALDRFLQRGGGVFLVMPQSVGHLQSALILDPLGIGFDTLEIIGADMRADRQSTFGYTTDIELPFGEAVSGIWYPVRMGWTIATRPLRVAADAGWRVVMRGSPQSRTKPVDVVGYGKPGDDLPGYAASVPLMAVRDGMPGRMAVCSVSGDFNLYSPHRYDLGQRLMRDGFDGRPSDLLALTRNTLRWVMAPAIAGGRLGGAEPDPRVLDPQVPMFPDDPPVRWAVGTFPRDPQAPRRGLIGARTAYSTGRGTVADYVARAKAAGHDLIVFLESFPEIDAAGLAALKADCEAHSSDTFLAVPGYTFKDVVGSHYFVYGYQAELPVPDLLSEDGKVLSNRPAGQGRATRVDLAHCYLIFGELKTRCRKGAYRHADNPKGIIDQRYNDSFALVTWEDDRLIDDARDAYRMIMDKGVRLHPTALTFMNGPEDFDPALASGWHNTFIEPYAAVQDDVLRKHMAPELEYWGRFDENLVRGPRYRFDNWQYGMPFQTATRGPLIREWTVSVSARDPEWRTPDHEIPPTADWFRLDAAHFRLRIAVTSDAGLAEVLLYDGDRLLRRWQCNGARSFEQDLDFIQAQQMHLLLEARDVQGGTAHTSDYMVYRRDWCEFHCADRNNPLQIGYQKDAHGRAHGWSGTRHLTYNNAQWGGTSPWIGKYWFYGDQMYPVPMDPVHDDTAPIDGGVGYAGAGLHLKPGLPAWNPPERGLMLNPLQEMISPDAAVCGFICDHGYDPEESYFQAGEQGWGLYAVYPTRYFEIRRRRTVFRPRPHALTTAIVQHELRFKREPSTPTASMSIGWISVRDAVVLHRGDGQRQALDGADVAGMFPLVWRRGECLAAWTQGARPALFINDGCDLLLERDASRQLRLLLPLDPFPGLEATTTLRVIGIGGSVEHTDPDLYDRVVAVMGLSGGEPGYRCSVELGAIRSTRLMLELEAAAGQGVAFRIPQTELPMALPVIVYGLNPNWTTVFLDRETGRWRPLGVLDDTAYATLDTTAQAWQAFIGHPLTATHPAIVINLAQTGASSWRLEVHNPLTEPVNTTLRRSPFFDRIEMDDTPLELAPGTSVFVAY